MRKNKIISFTLLMLLPFLAQANPQAPQVVMNIESGFEPGSFSPKGNWMGLFCASKGCELRQVKVKLKNGKVEYMGDKIDVQSIHVSGKPQVLFYNIPLKTGKVTTWFHDFSLYDYEQARKVIDKGFNMPWGKEPLSFSKVELPNYKGFEIFVSNGVKKEKLMEVTQEYDAPVFPWIGDLNGDGKVDYLVNIQDNTLGCTFDHRLYLSSPTNSLNYQMWMFTGDYPACGC